MTEPETPAEPDWQRTATALLAERDALRERLAALIEAHARTRKADDDFNRTGFLIDNETPENEAEWRQVQDEQESAHVALIRLENEARALLTGNAVPQTVDRAAMRDALLGLRAEICKRRYQRYVTDAEERAYDFAVADLDATIARLGLRRAE